MSSRITRTLNTVEKEHETFKSALVDDVFGKDTHGKVQMEKVVMLIWQFRDDPTVIQFMAQFVAKFAGQRDVFQGIEFYLPQLAHMIIHLEVDWDDAILERFALIIAQQSLHFALQLNWILQGAIEDYEPELPSGERNPGYNALFYSRCVKLLSNIERCVVYGRPRSLELQRLYEKGKITKAEYEILEHADRRFNALEITSNQQESEQHEKQHRIAGELLYKRKFRVSCWRSKGWKTRYFAIENRMLQCFKTKGGALLRSMPLENATVEDKIKHRKKYPNMFMVANRGFQFIMRASCAADKELWMTELQEEAKAHALFDNKEQSANLEVLQELTPSQRSRFDFFKNERDFIRNLCQIAEDLRFKDRVERKQLAPGLVQELNIPPVVYLPLCNSTDIWKRVAITIPKDTKVFNTKERCPIIMNFVSKRGELISGGEDRNANLDVADFMHLQFDILKDSEEPEKKNMEVIEEDENGEMGSPHASENDLRRVEETKEEEKVDSDIDKSGHSQGQVGTVWHEPVTHSDSSVRSRHPPIRGGNRQVQSFMRHNLVSVPHKIATRIESRRRLSTMSILDKAAKPISTVPILEGNRSFEDSASVDETSVLSVERGSVLFTSSAFLLGDPDQGDIDSASMERAKELVCHGETWADKTKRMLQENVAAESQDDEEVSEISSLMAKSNDDLRQEVFVMQMIHYYKSVFAKADLPLWLKTYRILSTSQREGLIEALTDATSMDALKKTDGYPKEGGLRAYFEQTYGEPSSKSFIAAQTNFMQSLAAYSLVAYLLGLKDRHNGNIMIDTRGHLIFIDFGFAMGMAPGHEFSFEKAPFKITQEYVNVMGGVNSECFAEFKRLFVAGMQAARSNSLIALGLVEIIMYKSNYPCFTGTRYGHGKAIKKFERRLLLHVPDDQVERQAERLISKSIGNFGTCLYDAFQKWTNDYAM